MYHSPSSVIDSSLSSRPGCPTCRTSMGMYFFMNECHGVPLNTVVDGLSFPEFNDIRWSASLSFLTRHARTRARRSGLYALPPESSSRIFKFLCALLHNNITGLRKFASHSTFLSQWPWHGFVVLRRDVDHTVLNVLASCYSSLNAYTIFLRYFQKAT